MQRKTSITKTIAAPEQSEFTEKQNAVINALITGMNQTEAAEHVGVSREYVCRLCHQDHFLKELDRRVNRTKTLLAPRALANVASMADNAVSERVKLDANLGILDRAGHGLKDSNVISIQTGELNVHIDLS